MFLSLGMSLLSWMLFLIKSNLLFFIAEYIEVLNLNASLALECKTGMMFFLVLF